MNMQFKTDVCQRFLIETSVPVCLKASLCCLHVFFVSVSGSGTIKWAGDLYLTPRAKICFSSGLFCLPLPLPSLSEVFRLFSPSMFFFFHVFVCLRSDRMKITEWRRRREEQDCSLLFFVLSFPLFLLADMQAVGMLGVSKLASVLGVPGE